MSSTLIGARTIEHLRANLASLELTLTSEQTATLDSASTPSLNFPATVNDGAAQMLGFGGTTVDGIQTPVWPMLLTNAQRY